MKTKIFFVIGLLMLMLFVAYALIGCFVPSLYLWRYKEMWNAFYIYSAIMIAIFLLPSVIHIIMFVRDDDTALNMAAAICGSVGCAMLGFGLAFFWYAVNRPQFGLPISLELTDFIYGAYLVIMTLALIGAVGLKITVGVNNVKEFIQDRRASKANK